MFGVFKDMNTYIGIPNSQEECTMYIGIYFFLFGGVLSSHPGT